jgi:hypothetical protein
MQGCKVSKASFRLCLLRYLCARDFIIVISIYHAIIKAVRINAVITMPVTIIPTD